ncbi:MAG: hypothetical protein K2J80_01200 [Oscillospiraceae bacterium]|nr:hypothetical protein [Oscillospiraceae bacterium]
MNRNLKAIGAAILAAVMCASFAGCSKKGDNGVYVDKNGNVSVNESKLENHVNSVFGGGNTNNSTSAPEPAEIELAITDEIKNAALGSGLVQCNNDIFQRGGYMTVADFVEKYKDRYDIFYNYSKDYSRHEAPYDECKDYLLEYDKDEDIFKEYGLTVNNPWENRDGTMTNYAGNDYYLTLKPKNGGNFQPVTAYVVNATSPDEKITLDKAIVVEIESAYINHKYVTPQWFPMGLNGSYYKDKIESENKNYTVKNLGEALEAKGLKKCGEEIYEEYRTLPGMKEENYNTYWVTNSYAGCYVLGEENLFGAKPLYYYSFKIDPNTDKLDYAELSLEYFVKD